MTISIKALQQYCNELLASDAIKDYCPNGLQIEGNREIKALVTGVSLCQDLIDQAIEAEADCLLVHHGMFWRGESDAISSIKRKRIASVLSHGMHILAYHLPLDVHPALGNNIQLASLMGWKHQESVACLGHDHLLMLGQTAQPQSLEEMLADIRGKLHREAMGISAHQRKIKQIAWCTGAAADALDTVALHQVDAFVTGEIAERHYHQARELGIHLIAAGHHATERYGVQALGAHLASTFNISHDFIDIDNPV